LIDLHLHTTASDGTLDPDDLVDAAYRAGVQTLSITDHDTMAGVPVAASHAADLGLEFLPGVEITAVYQCQGIHILGYFLDVSPPGLISFLNAQQEYRVERARKIAAKLANLGFPIDIDTLIDQAECKGSVVARPLIATLLVAAGHVRSEREAFDRWLGDQRPAYVPFCGSSPSDVVRLISRVGGVSALAHPGLLGRDELIPNLSRAGLTALEAHHSAHNQSKRAHYAKLAARHGLAVSGGSDYHGDRHHRAKFLGAIGPSRDAFNVLLQRLHQVHGVVHGSV
jgi:predicted metal-dependent phosphoesterase TrpH